METIIEIMFLYVIVIYVNMIIGAHYTRSYNAAHTTETALGRSDAAIFHIFSHVRNAHVELLLITGMRRVYGF